MSDFVQNGFDEGWMKLCEFFDSRSYAPIISLDIETYSPQGFPYDKGDPIVAAGIAIPFNRKIKSGVIVVSVICNPPLEVKLLDWIFKILSLMPDTFLLTYNGKNFDIPYIVSRAKRYRIDISNTLNKFTHMDLYEIIKYSKIPFPRLSQNVVEKYLGLERSVDGISGANYHRHYLNFLKDGSTKPILYNIEDTLLMHLILNTLNENSLIRWENLCR